MTRNPLAVCRCRGLIAPRRPIPLDARLRPLHVDRVEVLHLVLVGRLHKGGSTSSSSSTSTASRASTSTASTSTSSTSTACGVDGAAESGMADSQRMAAVSSSMGGLPESARVVSLASAAARSRAMGRACTLTHTHGVTVLLIRIPKIYMYSRFTSVSLSFLYLPRAAGRRGGIVRAGRLFCVHSMRWAPGQDGRRDCVCRVWLAWLPDYPPSSSESSEPCATPCSRPSRGPRSIGAWRVPHVRICGRHREALPASPGSEQRRCTGSDSVPPRCASLPQLRAAGRHKGLLRGTPRPAQRPAAGPPSASAAAGGRRQQVLGAGVSLGRLRAETSLRRRRGAVSPVASVTQFRHVRLLKGLSVGKGLSIVVETI